MVRVFVDYDVITVPEPVATAADVKGSNAKVEAAEPESAGTASREVPDMAAAETSAKVAVLPGMVEVKSGIIASGIVPNPFAVVVHVRGFGMAFLIAERRVVGRGVRSAVKGRRTVPGNVSATDRVATSAMGAMLRPDRQCEEQNCTEKSDE